MQPRCSHFTCVDCFKLCYYSYEIIEPKFPYPELEDEYDDEGEEVPEHDEQFDFIPTSKF